MSFLCPNRVERRRKKKKRGRRVGRERREKQKKRGREKIRGPIGFPKEEEREGGLVRLG